MYLAGDGFSQIDSLNSLNELNNKPLFDYILTNPPFGKGDFKVDPSIVSNKRKEINFLIKVINLLKSEGKCLIIVPDGILESPTLSRLRQWLIKNCQVEKVIGLPKYEFAPYTHEKTYVLFLRKRPTPIADFDEVKTERVWMYIIDNDGFANSDKRFRTGKKDEDGKYFHDELSLWRDNEGTFHISVLEKNWKKKIQGIDEKYFDIHDNEIQGNKYGYIEMSKINEENFYNLLCEFHLRPIKIKRVNEKDYINELKSVKKTIESGIDSIDEIFK
jgi:type I restriction enzyme M protein